MNTITPRAFVHAIASGATPAVSEPAHAGGQASERVDFTGDGVPLSAAEYAQPPILTLPSSASPAARVRCA